MKTIKHLYILLAVVLLAALPATAQNTNDNANKAIIETNDGNHELNTDDIQVIRFDGGKITIVQPSGETTFDRTLHSLTFQRPNPGTLRLTVSTSIGSDNGSKRAQSIDGDGKLRSYWAEGDEVYVYADASSTTSIGTLTPKNYGTGSATLSGNINAEGLTNNQTLYFSTKDRATLDLSQQDGTVESLFYFTATGTLTINGGNASITNLTFSRPIAIVKFTLKDKGTNDLSVTSLSVNDGTNNYTVTPTSATNVLFVGIPATGTVNLSTTVGGISYSYNKTGANLLANKYYAINVKMTNKGPVGALPGKFTINSGGGQVSFSMGNLQYQASTGTWRFAPNQYDMIGSDNANISDSYTGWIDLLGWGTGDAPTKSSTSSGDYSTFTDWGVNAISNGGNTADLWSTLTKDEWAYLLEHHTKRWSTVNGVNGYVIRPDGVSTAVAASYTASEWAVEEAAGSVFLPAACSRGGTTFNAGSWGDYWSSTAYNSDDAYYLYFNQGGQNPSSACRWGGRSVRLVYEPPYFQGAGTEADPYLISSADDWNYLAIKVNSGTSYAGKFFRQTEDISVTTMVGNSESNSFRGTFDGDGHTLTISYNTTSDYSAPFRYIQGATFKNLKVTGSITTTMNLAAGIAGLNTGSTATFEQCVTDIAITSSSSTEVGWGAYDYHGGFLARSNGANVNLTDCVCGGSVDGSSSSKSKCAGFVGVAENCTVSATRCLSTTSYTNVSSWNSLCHQAGANRTVNVFYYVNANDVGEDVGTQVTTLQLADGSYATALQAGRSTTVWVQYSRTNQPMLKQFATYTVTYHANGGSGSAPAAQAKQQGVDLTLSNSTLTFGGFTQTGWNTNSDGSGTHYDLGGTYSANADVTLYAEWSSLTFNYTGAVQTFTVPATGYYTLECYGAQGGYSSGGLGGKGGLSQLTYPLTQGDVLYIYAGGQGECIDGSSSHPTGGDGGWNGGGKGGTGVAWSGGNGAPYNGGGGGGGATHIATSAIGPIGETTSFDTNHTGLLLIAGGGGGGLSWGSTVGGAGGGDVGGNGCRDHSNQWNIAWNNGTLSCGKDGMTSSTGGGSCEGCGGGGAGYVGGNTWTVTYNAGEQSYSGAGGSSWGETTNGKGYSTTAGGATVGGNGKAVITWYGTTYPTD